MKKTRSIFIIWLLLVLGVSFARGQTAQLKIVPADSGLFIGDTLRLAIQIESSTPVGSFEFKLKFRHQFVTDDSVLMGPFLGSSGRIVSPVGPSRILQDEWKIIRFAGISFGSSAGATGTGDLAWFDFIGKNIGSTPLMLEDAILTTAAGQSISIQTIEQGQLTVWPDAADRDSSRIFAEPVAIPADGNSTSRITVIPVDSTGTRLPAGQKVELTTTAGTWLDDSTQIHADGSYSRMLQSSLLPDLAEIRATVNGDLLNQFVMVEFFARPNWVVRVNPPDNQVALGKTVIFSIEADSVWDVGAFELTLEYSKNIAQFDSVWLGNFLNQNGRTGSGARPIVQTNGPKEQVTFAGFSSGQSNGAQGSGMLAYFSLKGNQIGSTDLNLTQVRLLSPTGKVLTVNQIENGLLQVRPGEVDLQNSILKAEPDTLPADAISSTLITLIPVGLDGTILPPGQDVSFQTTLGTLLDSAVSLENGTYTQRLLAPSEPGTATITANINGQALPTTIQVVFIPQPPLDVVVWPRDTTVSTGNSFVVRIGVENVYELGSFQFTLSFLTEFVQVDSVWLGDFFAKGSPRSRMIGPFIENSNSIGFVKFGGISWEGARAASGSGTVAFIKFRPQKLGESYLNLSNVKLTNKAGTVWSLNSVQNGAVTIAQSLVDVRHSKITANPPSIPADGIAATLITVIPKNSAGNMLPPGQEVEVTTSAGNWIDSVKSLPDGTYQRILRASTSVQAATISALVNGIEISPVSVNFVAPIQTTIQVTPTDTTIRQLGSKFELRVEADSVSNFGGFQFSLAYRNKILKLEAVHAEGFPGSTGRTYSTIDTLLASQTAENDSLKIVGFTFGNQQGPNGGGALVRLRFVAQDTGTTAIQLFDYKFTNIEGRVLPVYLKKDGRVNVTVGEIDSLLTTVTAQPQIIPADGQSVTEIKVIPKGHYGQLLGAGQDVQLTTTAGTLPGTVNDHGDGSYTQQLQAGNQPATAEITAVVNSVKIKQRPRVSFVPPTRFYPFTSVPQKTAGDSIEVSIKIERISTYIPNLAKIKFKLNFTNSSYLKCDLTSIEPGEYFGITDEIDFSYSVTQDNQIQFETGRKDGEATENSLGQLAKLRFVTDNYTPDSTIFIFSMTDVQADDESSQLINLNVEDLKVTIRGLLVWPGDTNNDGVVDHFDVLPIGLSYFQTGPARLSASTNWQGQHCTRWLPIEATYADATGNGLVDEQDVAVVDLNWQKTHGILRKEQAPEIIKGRLIPVIAGANESTVQIELHLDQLDSLHGFGFEMTYPTRAYEVISVVPAPVWGTKKIRFTKIDPGQGSLAFSICSLNQPAIRFGKNPAARIIFNKKPNQKTQNVNFEFENCKGISRRSGYFNIYAQSVALSSTIENPLPKRFSLEQNYPNPFNPITTIEYSLAKKCRIKLTVHNMLGCEIQTLVNTTQAAGEHRIKWDATRNNGNNVSSGFYFYRLQADDFTAIKKCLLLK